MRSRPLALVFMLCLIAAASCSGKAGPGQTVSNFVRYVEAGNTDAAIARLSSHVINLIGQEKLKLALTSQAETIKGKGGVSAIEIEKEEINGDTATVKGKLIYGNKETMPGDVRLIIENGEWKIDGNK